MTGDDGSTGHSLAAKINVNPDETTGPPVSRLLGIATVSAVVLFVWDIYTEFFGHFFYSPTCVKAMLAIAGITSLVLVIWIFIAEDKALSSLGLNVEVFGSLSPFLKCAGVPCWLLISVGYLPFVVLPVVLHHVFSEPYEDRVTVESTHQAVHTRHANLCATMKVEELRGYLFEGICISNQAYREIDAGDIVRLAGSKSWFGIDVTSYDWKQP